MPAIYYLSGACLISSHNLAKVSSLSIIGTDRRSIASIRSLMLAILYNKIIIICVLWGSDLCHGVKNCIVHYWCCSCCHPFRINSVNNFHYNRIHNRLFFLWLFYVSSFFSYILNLYFRLCSLCFFDIFIFFGWFGSFDLFFCDFCLNCCCFLCFFGIFLYWRCLSLGFCLNLLCGFLLCNSISNNLVHNIKASCTCCIQCKCCANTKYKYCNRYCFNQVLRIILFHNQFPRWTIIKKASDNRMPE